MGVNPATAAIREALAFADADDTVLFLQLWNEGEFDKLRDLFGELPDDVFMGAEVAYKPRVEVEKPSGVEDTFASLAGYIPDGVYYEADSDKFVDQESFFEKDDQFYETWIDRKAEFPTRGYF